ncbi:MAG: NifU family protein [Campylobacterota bacterium]|nr:NifU family protein [Campylobacterota bacterium]
MKDLKYYLSLDYPVEVYPGEHEIGDAYLAIFTDFDIKGASEDYFEAIDIAREYLEQHIKKQLELGKEIPNPREGVRFMSHREALKAYRAKDYDTALTLWKKEAELKSDQAMANLGLMYLKGEGVEKDFIKAKEWFEKGSEFGNDSANYNLALMYQSAIGIEEDNDKAVFYFREAVKKNHQGANFRLGLLLLKDRTDEQLVREGFESMLNAAKTGHPMAMVQMGGVDKPANKEAEKNKLFRAKPYEEQIEVIEDAINRYIRPILVKDGGDMMILDYINEPEIELRLAYQGACAGCSLGATSTYELIRSTLAQVIDDNIQIFII